SSLPECDLTRAAIDVFVLKFGSDLSGEIVHVNDDRANAGNEKVVTKHRGDGDAEGGDRGDERAGDARRHGDEAGRTGFGKTGDPGNLAFFSKRRSGCRSCRKAASKRAFCFRAKRITRNFVIMIDQLKIEAMARRERTSFPAIVA